MAEKHEPSEAEQKTPEQIEEATLEARQYSTVELLDYLKTSKAEAAERIETNKPNEADRTEKEKKRLESLKKSVGKIDDSLDAIGDPNKRDIEPGAKYIAGLIKGQQDGLENKKWNVVEVDQKIVSYISSTVETVLARAEDGATLSASEIASFESYVKIFKEKTKDDAQKTTAEAVEQRIAELKKKIEELKSKPEAEPEEEEEKSKPEKTKKAKEKTKEKPEDEEPEKKRERHEIGEEVINESEVFRSVERGVIDSYTAKFVETGKISDESKKVFDEALQHDMEVGYQAFASSWFNDHYESHIKDRGIPKDYPAHKKLELMKDLGFNPEKEIRKGEYKEFFSDKMEELGTLRIDLAKEKMPPETPYLLLNCIQKREIPTLMAKIDGLRARGDAAAEMELAHEEKQLELLLAARKELIEKTMGENVEQTAERRIQAEPGYKTKDRAVTEQFPDEAKKTKEQRNQELLDMEWERFNSLSEKEKSKYGSKMGYDLTSKGRFIGAIIEMSKKNGVEGDSFYGLLAKDCKPYEVRSRMRLWPLNKFNLSITEMARHGKPPYETNGDEKEFDAFAAKAGTDYNRSIVLEAVGKLEGQWDAGHSQKLKAETNKRINELASQPELAEDGIESIYKKARERILAEYIADRAKKSPKTAKQIEGMRAEIKENDMEVDITDIIKDTYYQRDEFEDVFDYSVWEDKDPRDRNAFYGKVNKYLKRKVGLGIGKDIFKKVTKDRYAKIWETKTGLFAFILEVMQDARKAKKRPALRLAA